MSQYLDKDGVSRIAENFLLKQAEQDAVLRNLQFDLKEAEHALVKTIQAPAPLNIRALTRPLDDYLISGNTVQNGTPSPEAPVDVVGCGVKTGNLFDATTIENGIYLAASGKKYGDVTNGVRLGTKIKVLPNTAYTLSVQSSEKVSLRILEWSNGTFTKEKPIYNISGIVSLTVTTTTETTEIAFNIEGENGQYATNIMLNLGSTPLPYEPYGYKLPLTCGGTEYPIYLGQVESTRRIKKLVLTGDEGWTITSNGVLRIGLSGQLRSSTPLCTHYLGSNSSAWSNVPDKSVTVSINGYLAILDTTYTAVSDFKSYLAQQYAAGTPVTVWYVLATPETAIVNEPLHKISNYADTISYSQAGVEISTTKGFNTIATNTTVLPSNIQVKGVINNA